MIHTVAPQRSAGEAWTPPGTHHLPGPISWEPLPDSVGEELPPGEEGPPAIAELDSAEVGGAPPGEGFHPEAIAASLPRVSVAVQSLGPVGRRHSAAVAMLLALCTLGLYPVFWAGRANREMADFDPRMVVRAGRTAMAFFVPVMVCMGVAVAAAARIVAGHYGYNYDLPISYHDTRWLLAAPLLIAPLTLLVPFSAVAVTMTMERIRVVEDRAGVDPEHQVRPAASLGFLMIPLIGVAVVVARAQRRLNRVWATSV